MFQESVFFGVLSISIVLLMSSKQTLALGWKMDPACRRLFHISKWVFFQLAMYEFTGVQQRLPFNLPTDGPYSPSCLCGVGLCIYSQRMAYEVFMFLS